MRTVDFLDAIKKRHNLASDYAVSKLLGWERVSRIYEYRHSGRELDDEACVQVAVALDLPPPYVMACIAAARAKDATIKKYWLTAARLLKTGTAAVILATAVGLSQPAPASTGPSAALKLTPYTLCAKRRRLVAALWRRRRRRKLHTVTPRTPILASRT